MLFVEQQSPLLFPLKRSNKREPCLMPWRIGSRVHSEPELADRPYYPITLQCHAECGLTIKDRSREAAI